MNVIALSAHQQNKPVKNWYRAKSHQITKRQGKGTIKEMC